MKKSTRKVLCCIMILDLLYVGAGIDGASATTTLLCLIPAMICLVGLGAIRLASDISAIGRNNRRKRAIIKHATRRRQFSNYLGMFPSNNGNRNIAC